MSKEARRAALSPAPAPASARDDELLCRSCGRSFAKGIRVCPNDGSPLEDRASAADPLIGATLGGSYRITRLFATGGMGRVYEAEHTRLERRLVVKMLHESQAHSKAALERAEREARATSGIASEHVVELVDFVRAPDGRPGIVMPFLEGEDLQDRLDRVGKLSVQDAIGLALQVCAGLAAAHANGVVHRDLKPSNIFLVKREDGTDRAMILDFGVAKLADAKGNITHTGSLVGTPAYMAPEQALGASTVDHRADVYAVGAVLYHMLTGQPPYGDEDATTTLMGLLKGEPPRARSIEKSIPEALEAVLERAMAREPKNRIPTADALASELAPFASATYIGTLSSEIALAPMRPESLRPSAAGPTIGELTARARWVRPVATARLLLASVLAALWVGGFGAALVFELHDGRPLNDVERVLMPIVPGAMALILVGLSIAALAKRWRSAPEIERISGAAKSALVAALVTAGCFELGLRAIYAFTVSPANPMHLDAVVSLGFAGIAGVVTFGRTRK